MNRQILYEGSLRMPVQFVLGEHPTKKRENIINYMHDYLTEYPDAQLVYLVPDNVKYEAETMVLEQFKKNENSYMSGMINLQVFSFSRLAWYLLQNKPIYQQPQLTESGLSMLLTKILQEKEDELTIYRGASQEIGFVERLVKLFSEFRNGKIAPSDLVAMLEANEDQDTSNDFKLKLQDLHLIYSEYDKRLAGSYLEREDLFEELIEFIKAERELFSKLTIIVDHYEHFSAQELELILTLAKYAKNLLISLTLSKEAAVATNDLNNPFYRPLKTYQHLIAEFQTNNIQVLENVFIGQLERKSLEEQSEIELLGNYWLESSLPMSSKEIEKYQKQTYEDIQIWGAEDNDAEVLHVATKIKRMVASGNYRYKDFQIMTRDIEGYKLSIEALFTENEIPYFIDQAEKMSQHPLLEFVVSLFSIKKRHYRIDDIFRFLRTELFIPMEKLEDCDPRDEEALLENIEICQEAVKSWREKLDVAENVVLAYGYEGNDWSKDKDWIYTRFELDDSFKQDEQESAIQETANEVRKTFYSHIVAFLDSLDDSKTNREVATALYQFMDQVGVIQMLEHWRNQLMVEGALEEARKHEQAWDNFVLLLDEFVEVLGDDHWDVDLFISIIEAGFEQATYSMVPPTIDQVLVTNYDLPKIQSKKIVFLIGLTDTQLPRVQESQSLLTDEDRELVEGALPSEKYLAVSEMESVANEPFGLFLNILQADEKIIFTYPLTNGDNGENRISPYIDRIRKALALDIQFKHLNAISDSRATVDDYLEFVGSSRQTFGQIIISLRHALDHLEQPKSFWLGLFNELYNPYNRRHYRLLRSLSHENLPVPLTDELAKELYGEHLYLSVSQLESFYTDPYSHFLLYGLRLREREVQELTPIESGNFYHDALDLISRQLLRLNKDLSTVTEAELNSISKDIFDQLLATNKYRLSQSSNRMRFIFKQLTKTVRNQVWAMINQAKRSKFRTNKTELVFGQLGDQQDVRGLSFDLQGNRKLHLRGKVDRIDTFVDNNQLYAGIVDYKSSQTTFNYQSLYHGLMLQMITYLDTVLTFSKDIFDQEALGIGAFYSTVNDYFIDLQDLKNKDLHLERLKNYKLDGLIVDRMEVLNAADTALNPSEHSPLFNLYLKKDGSYSNKKILTEEEFRLLLRYNREKIIEAGNRIISGENTLHPFNKRNFKVFTPSVDGPYRAISQFDALLPENNYQDINKIDKDDFFDYLKEKYSDKQKEDKN